MNAHQLKNTRLSLHLTVDQFAKVMNVTPSAVSLWENGQRTPQGPALQLLRVIMKYPGLIQELLS